MEVLGIFDVSKPIQGTVIFDEDDDDDLDDTTGGKDKETDPSISSISGTNVISTASIKSELIENNVDIEIKTEKVEVEEKRSEENKHIVEDTSENKSIELNADKIGAESNQLPLEINKKENHSTDLVEASSPESKKRKCLKDIILEESKKTKLIDATDQTPSPTNNAGEFVYINKLLMRISDCIIIILKEFAARSHIIANGINTTETVQHTLKTLLDIKKHFFNISFVIVENIILPNSDDMNFINKFVADTIEIGKSRGYFFEKSKVQTLLREMIIWTKNKKETSSVVIPNTQNTEKNISNVTMVENACVATNPIQVPAPNYYLVQQLLRPQKVLHLNSTSIQENSTHVPSNVSVLDNLRNRLATQMNNMSGLSSSFESTCNVPVSNFQDNPLNNTTVHSTQNPPWSRNPTSMPYSNQMLIQNSDGKSVLPPTSINSTTNRRNSDNVIFSRGTPGYELRISVDQSVVEKNNMLAAKNPVPNRSKKIAKKSKKKTNENENSSQQLPQPMPPCHQVPYQAPQMTHQILPQTTSYVPHRAPHQFSNQFPNQFTPHHLYQSNQPSHFYPTNPSQIPLQHCREPQDSSQPPPPPYRSLVQNEQQAQEEITRSLSTDSGFMSPTNFSIPSNAPVMQMEVSDTASQSNKANCLGGQRLQPQNCSVCGVLTVGICKGCEKNYYCSYKCQEIDWPLHRQHCFRQIPQA